MLGVFIKYFGGKKFNLGANCEWVSECNLKNPIWGHFLKKGGENKKNLSMSSGCMYTV